MEPLKLAPRLSDEEVDQRIVEYEEREAREKAEQAAAEMAKREALRGIPVRFAGVPPEPWIPGFIYGPAGVGKTHLAIARLQSVGGVFVSAMEYLELAHAIVWDRADDRQERRWRRIEKAQHLVLDDVGSSRMNEFASEKLLRLTDLRWSGMLETLCTSNLPPLKLNEVLDERLASRILGFGPWVSLSGIDRRVGGTA